MSKAMLFDSTLCIGCRACESACAEKWGLPYNDQIGAEERISAHKLTAIKTHGERFSRRLCMHCAEPTCVSVCPVGAFRKTADGPVVYDADKCIGCRYCLLACPFSVPSYEWSSRQPRVRKCDFCAERQEAGRPTACSEACPTQATISGERTALLAEAKRRIAEKPAAYYPRTYGLKEAGGTSVFFLSAVPFEQLGLNTQLPDEPLPGLTWRALSQVPNIASAGAVLLGGVYWITHRREEVRRHEGGGKERLS